jgi:hypothetical protein
MNRETAVKASHFLSDIEAFEDFRDDIIQVIKDYSADTNLILLEQKIVALLDEELAARYRKLEDL